MTRDDILRMAREAGLLMHADAKDAYIRDGVYAEHLERFYALAVAKEREARQQAQREAEVLRERIVKSGLELHRAVRDAVKEEREACAKACDAEAAKWPYPSHANAAVTVVAAAIRARQEMK